MPSTAGALTEQLLIQENVPDPISVTDLTRSGTMATAQTAVPHGYATNDYVTIAGASPAGYNGKFKITVTTASAFTYIVSSSLATPATGTMTVVYVSDVQGGRKIGWQDLATVAAEVIPVRALEKLQVQALQGQLDCRFRVRVRADLTTEMRARWTPRWPPGAATHTFEIHGILPDGAGEEYLLLECGEVR